MKNLITFLSIICVTLACKKECDEASNNEVLQVVEIQAEFPNGQDGLNKWLEANIQYPEDAKENKIEGKVVVRFVVEKEGSVTSAEVLSGVHLSLDNEAKRVVMAMPKWKPAKSKGKSVRSYFTLPIVFKL
jgi:protein TonB